MALAEISRSDALGSPESPLLGKTIGIVGGGPAGAFLGYLLAGKGIAVELFESRTPVKPEAGKRKTCPGCAGWIQKDTVELLKRYGIEIPESTIQTHLINAVVNFPDTTKQVTFPIPGSEAVFRGFAPIDPARDAKEVSSFDAFLLKEAIDAGVTFHPELVIGIDLTDPIKRVIKTSKRKLPVDMVIGAFGHSEKLMQEIIYPEDTKHLEIPKTSRAGVREYYLNPDIHSLRDNVHIFGNPSKNVSFAAVVPKNHGKYVTVVLMGKGDIQPTDFDAFFANPQVQKLLGDKIVPDEANCRCRPTITRESPTVFTVMYGQQWTMTTMGDAGPTRPQKNGIGAALDSAQKCADLLLRYGNTHTAEREYKRYIDHTYVWDNYVVNSIFTLTDMILNHRIPRKMVLYLAGQNEIPALASLIQNGMRHLITGDGPYWTIPLEVFKNMK